MNQWVLQISFLWVFFSDFKQFTKHYFCVVKCIFLYSRLKLLTWLLRYVMNRYGNVFHFNFIVLSRCAGWLEGSQHFLFGDLGQVLTLPVMSGGAQLTALLCSYFLFGGQSKALVRSWILLPKDLFLWIEFKIREYFQWNKASVLIRKIETSFVGMSATHPTLSRESAVNRENHKWELSQDPFQREWVTGLMQFSPFCVLAPLKK